MKSVAIVGGGYAGSLLAQKLDGEADVTLIESRPCFVHNVAAIRAVTEPALLSQIILPYDRMLRRGRVIRDRATALSEELVTLASGATVAGDVVVVATGSSYAAPFKPQDEQIESFRLGIERASELVRAARHVVIGGAGAVGIELAGEIISHAPATRVTLVDRGMTLLPNNPPALGRQLEAQLKARGVTICHGAIVEGLVPGEIHTSDNIRLSDGTRLDPGLVVPAFGAKPRTALLRSVPGLGYDPLGRVRTDGWMRPAGLPWLFAVGDAAANGDAMTIVALIRQVDWLAKALCRLPPDRSVAGLTPYAPYQEQPLLVPLGPRGGASALPVGDRVISAGSGITALIKGRGLFIRRYRREFGL